MNRTKNATRNVIYGIILKIYQLAIPFIMRTIMIYTLGIQYLGLNSLFSSILQVLNLAELGVGSAMVYSMYKPITEHDSNKICALMNLYKLYYRIIGIVICCIGLVLTPFIPNLINGNIPSNINIYVLYLLNLFATVFSYWLFAYKNAILQAHQRADITSKVLLITETIKYILQIFVLVLLKNYYLFVIVLLISQILTNIITAYMSNKMYPNYQAKGKLKKVEVASINHRIRDLFTSKIGAVIVNSGDSIVISAFLGLQVLAIYQNYYFVMNSIYALICVIFGSVIAGIGNSLLVESLEKNYRDLKIFTFTICFLLCICCSCFLVLYQPFMKLWVGENLLLPLDFVILFIILFYCLSLSMVWATVKDAAGMWHEDRFRPLIGASTNLFLNIVLVNYIGLYGVILSTVISYVFISMPWLIRNLFALLYKRSSLLYIKDIILYLIVTIVLCAINYYICSFVNINGFLGILLKGFICLIVSVILQSILFKRKSEYIQMLEIIKRIVRK